MSLLRNLFAGKILLEIASGDIFETIKVLEARGIRPKRVEVLSPLSARLWIRERRMKAVESALRRRGDALRILERSGGLSMLKRHSGRVPLAAAISLLSVAALLLPEHILFVRVTGNGTIQDQHLLQVAEDCGIRFGVKGESIRSEQLKNKLLERIPELRWAGINIHGCVATITVSEREPTEQIRQETVISDIVAARDGILVSVSILEGASQCRAGQAVRMGDLLVSGCIEHEYQPQYSHSEAEIYALTQHPNTIVVPKEVYRKEVTGTKHSRYGLLVGRKFINLSGNSGIPQGTCDKMYLENYVTLPGGYQLPIGIRKEIWMEYTLTADDWGADKASQALEETALRLTAESMLAGEILGGLPDQTETAQTYVMMVNYTCREMIARQRTLYLFEGEHTDVGTNH